MKFFERGLSRLIIVGMGDVACRAVEFCTSNDIEVAVVSGPRFRDLPSVDPDFGTCYERMRHLGVEIDEVADIGDGYLSKYKCDDCAVFSVASPFTFDRDTIDQFDGVVFNDHGAHLPHGKGGGGFSWRILENDREGVVLIHLVTTEVDAGPIVYREPFVFPDACRKPLDFMEFQYRKSVPGLEDFLARLRDNAEFTPVPQDDYFGSFMPRLHTASQAFIDWSWEAGEIRSFVLAFSEPYEGAKTFVQKQLVYVRDCYVDQRITHGHPFTRGIIFNITEEGLRVACRGGTLVITEFEVAEGTTLDPGDRLHTPASRLEAAFEGLVVYTASGLKRT